VIPKGYRRVIVWRVYEATVWSRYWVIVIRTCRVDTLVARNKWQWVVSLLVPDVPRRYRWARTDVGYGDYFNIVARRPQPK
jgi:hypothetical protein